MGEKSESWIDVAAVALPVQTSIEAAVLRANEPRSIRVVLESIQLPYYIMPENIDVNRTQT